MGIAGPRRNRAVGWVARHPVATLLAWSFTVGQAVAFLPLVASSRGVELPVHLFTAVSTWVGLLLPAVVITRLTDGPSATRGLLSRLTAVRRPMRWYALCLAVVPITSLAVSLAAAGVAPETTPVEVGRTVVVGFALPAGLHLLTNNLWEELAWTGFVQERLQVRHSPILAAFLTAPLFALQHTPLVAGNTLVGGIVVMGALVALAVPFRAVMAWILNRTGSLFLVGLAHACGNAVVTSTVLGEALIPALYGRNLGPVHLFCFAVIGVVVLVATRGRLGLDNLPRHIIPAVDTTRGGTT